MWDKQYLIKFCNRGGVEPHQYEELTHWYRMTMELLNRGEIGREQIRELWDECGEAFSSKTLQGLLVRKPHGYAGDYEIIDKIHTRWISPEKHLESWDHYFHWTAAPKAVRNRGQYFCDLLRLTEKSCLHNAAVLNVACGPSRDVLNFFKASKESRLSVTGVDMDKNAINYSKEFLVDYAEQVELVTGNIFRYKTDRQFDLVWSGGLFGYLDDKGFIFLLRRLLMVTKKGGELIVGNFSPNNPTRANMEFGEWFLKYRSPEALRWLALKCNVNDDRITIESEMEGVNLFLRIRK